LKKIGAKKVKNGINKEKSGDPFYALKRLSPLPKTKL